MNYAVIFTYSFDRECPVYLFQTEDEAITFLRDSFNEEVRIDTEENEWNVDSEISEDGRYVKITDHFRDHDDVTEMRIGSIET